MKKITPTLIAAICCIASFAQTIPQQEWVQTFNGSNNLNDGAFVVGVDGSICVSGISETIPGVFKITTVKYDKNGVQLWAVVHNTPGNFTEVDFANDIKLDNAGNIYLAASVAIGVLGTDKEFTTLKYDSSGILQWTATHADTGEAYSLALDGAGNVYVTGWTKAGTPTKKDFTTVKYNSSGVQQWSVKYDGGDDDVANSIKSDGAGNVYITGWFWGTADFDPGAGTANLTTAGNNDIFIAKYNNNGAYQWAKSIGGAGWDKGADIAVDVSGNVYITGYFEDTADFDPGAGTDYLIGAGDRDFFFAKYNSSGIYQWANGIGGIGYDEGYSITADAVGNVYIGGYFGFTVDFDSGPDTANLINGGAFCAKYDSNGNYLWAKNIANYQANSIAVDDSENVYIAGSGSGIFFAKYNSSGSNQWIKSIGTTGQGFGFDITTDLAENIYITGDFDGTADFDPDSGISNQTSVGGSDIFVAKYGSSQCFTSSSFTYSATTVCEGEPVYFTNTSTSAITFQWLENGFLFSTSPDTARTFNTAGMYTISLIADSTNCSDSSGVIITVNPLPITGFSGLDTGYCTTDAAVTLTGTPSGGQFSGTGITGNQFDPVTAVTGMHTITYSYTDTNNCKDSTYQFVSVNNCTGIEKHDFIYGFEVIPNPSTGTFNIKTIITQNENIEIKIFNNLGQIIYSERFDQFQGFLEKKINLKMHPAGIYNLQLIAGQVVFTKLVIIE